MTHIEVSIWTQTFAYSIAMGRSLDTAAFNAARSIYLFRGDHSPIALEDSRRMMVEMRELSSASVVSKKEEAFQPFSRLGGT